MPPQKTYKNLRGGIFIALGSNLDQPIKQIKDAIENIAGHPAFTVLAQSSLYQTPPLGYVAQDDFINAVIEIETALETKLILRELQAIEVASGRIRTENRNGPRVLDLDLLLDGKRVSRDKYLEIPHPRMHDRGFVLLPLHEIAPDLILPGRGTLNDLLEKTELTGIVKLKNKT